MYSGFLIFFYRCFDGILNNKDYVFWGVVQEDVVCDVFVMYVDGIVLFVGVCIFEQKNLGNC